MRPWRHCNLLGKSCIVCMIINFILCVQLLKVNYNFSFLYLSCAFFCAMGTYSKKCKKVDDYLIFLKDIQCLSEVSALSILEVERSLFAFSQNYFKNDKLVLLKEQPAGVDSEIALAIAS